MKNMCKYTVSSLFCVAILFGGCSSKTWDEMKAWGGNSEVVSPKFEKQFSGDSSGGSSDRYVPATDTNPQKMKRLEDVIFYQKGVNGLMEEQNAPVTKSNIIVETREDETDLLPLELRKQVIDNLDYTNNTLGNVIRLILSQTPSIGLVVEPNVDLNKKVVGIIRNKNIYEALQDVVHFAAYDLYYSFDKKSLVVSAYSTKKYNIPAGIFIDRNAKVQLGQAGGEASGINPQFDMSNDVVYKTFMDGLKNVGSAEKIVSVDKQAGVIHVKERALYMKEVDDFIVDFVSSRIEQYSIELVVVQIETNKVEQFTLDLVDIMVGNKFTLSSLTGAALPATSLTSNGFNGAVISGASGKYTSPYDTSMGVGNAASVNKGLSFKTLLGIIDGKSYANVITRPNTMVQNHSIGYIAVGNEKSYVKTYKKEADQVIDGVLVKGTITPEIDSYRDGVQFAVRVDKYPKKDFIQLSLAPYLSNTTETAMTFDSTNTFTILDKSVKETFSVVNVKDGDVIILGGFKEQTKTGSKNEPLGSFLPWLGNVFQDSSSTAKSYETMFMIKVDKIKNASDSYSKPSYNAKDFYRKNKQ